MATVAQTLIDEVADEVSFDIEATSLLRSLDRRHKMMVRRSRILKGGVNLGSVVAGQAFYAVSNVMEVLELTVGGVPYGKANREDLYAASQGTLSWAGMGVSGLFVVDGETGAPLPLMPSGSSGISLIPTPEASGGSIIAFGAIAPVDLEADSVLMVPDEFTDGLKEGMIASGLASDSEQIGAADRFETRFDNACEELRRVVSRSLRPGVAQIRIVGVNA